MLYFILDLYLYFIIDPDLYFKICICILIKSVIACYYRSGFTFSICICIFMRSGINFYLLLNWQNLNIIKGISRIYPMIGAHFHGRTACLVLCEQVGPILFHAVSVCFLFRPFSSCRYTLIHSLYPHAISEEYCSALNVWIYS